MDEEKESARPGPWRKWLSWTLVGVMLLWAIGRTFGLERGFPFVQLMAYTPYVLVLSLLALLAVVLLRQWLPFVVGAIALATLAIAVVPREFGGPDEVTGGKSVRIFGSNLARGNADLAQLLEVAKARDVDVLSIQELTPEALAGLKSMDIASVYPYRQVSINGRGKGGGIFSRFPLKPRSGPPTEFAQPTALLSVPGAIPVELTSVHPMAPAGPNSTRQSDRDYKLMPAADTGPYPRILSGDFNATLDHANLRELIDTGYRDAGDVMGRGLITTWPSKLKWPLPVTLDHTLVEDPIAITDYDVEGIDRSDHRSIYTELVIPDEP